MKKITVCKDCPDRSLGCHGTCEKYIQEKAKTEALKHKIALEREIFIFAKDRRLEYGAKRLKKYGKLN
jgi:hypothetical protein